MEFIKGFAYDVVFGPVDGWTADDVLGTGNSAKVGVCLIGGVLVVWVSLGISREGAVV